MSTPEVSSKHVNRFVPQAVETVSTMLQRRLPSTNVHHPGKGCMEIVLRTGIGFGIIATSAIIFARRLRK